MSWELTSALEDYLKIIHELIREKGMARVRDICTARQVKSGSASPAMNRLAEMGLIEHNRGEFIVLTRRGEEIARRVRARHDTLLWLFRDFLGVDAAVAARDACEMEHHLSDTSLDALVRMHEHASEFLGGLARIVPPGTRLSHMHRESQCRFCRHDDGHDDDCRPEDVTKLSDLAAGDRCVVDGIDADDQTRVRLVNWGVIPGARLEINRVRKTRDVQILIEGNRVDLSGAEASAVRVRQEGESI